MIENFVFNDVVLYSKGWYRKTDLVSDLGYIFSKIYGWTPKTEEEVARFMLIAIDHLYTELEIPFDYNCNGKYKNSFASFSDEIKKRMRLYDVSYDMAIILFCLSIFQQLDNTQIKLNPPHFGKKEHFRLGIMFGEYPISQTYAEMNRRVNNFFNRNKHD
jgi:hypothetical protein